MWYCAALLSMCQLIYTLVMIRTQNCLDICSSFVNSIWLQAPLIMYDTFVRPKLVWPNKCSIWPDISDDQLLSYIIPDDNNWEISWHLVGHYSLHMYCTYYNMFMLEVSNEWGYVTFGRTFHLWFLFTDHWLLCLSLCTY